MISWAGWALSATVGASKVPYPGSHTEKVVGAWYTIYMASNDLQILEWFGFMRFVHPWIACMGRCQYLMFWFSYSSWGDCLRTPRTQYERSDSFYENLFLEENILEVLDVTDTMLLLGYTDFSYGHGNYAVLALGRERMLSEANMEKFQKVLQEKGIVREPVHFTGDPICIDDYMANEQIQTMSSK